MEFLQQLLRLAAIVTELVLLGVVTLRGTGRRVPMFVIYLYWSTLGDLAMYVYDRSGLPGYIIFCDVHVAIETLILVLLLLELALLAVRPFSKTLQRGVATVVGSVTVGAGTALWIRTDSFWPLFKPYKWFYLYLREDMTSSVVLVFILLLIGGMVEFLGRHYLPVGWGKREIQVATGLGIYALASLAQSLAITYQSLLVPWTFLAIAVGVALVYEICLIYWLVCFLKPDEDAGEVGEKTPADSAPAPLDLWLDKESGEQELREPQCV